MLSLPFPKNGMLSRHLIAGVLALAIFSLPLHFHAVVAAPQITKECSCFHGTRTQGALTAAAPGWLPFFVCHLFVPEPSDWSGVLSFLTLQIRAPPSVISL
jgi:hypothetical protein